MSYYELIQGDCLAVLSTLAPSSVDLVIADPPYHIEQKGKLTKQKGVIMSPSQAWGDWTHESFEEYDQVIKEAINKILDVLKPGGSCYLWLDRAKIGLYWAYIETLEGASPKNVLCWIKTQPMPHFRMNNYRSSYEQCIWFSKGKPNTFNFLSQKEMKNIFFAKNTIRETGHPTEKPLELIKWHIRVSSNQDDLVLDPFMGSGSTMKAAQQLRRSCIGIEINPEYCEMIKKRCFGRMFLDRRPEYKFTVPLQE